MKHPTVILCHVVGGIADGRVVPISLGTRKVRFPILVPGSGIQAVEYEVHWHDDLVTAE